MKKLNKTEAKQEISELVNHFEKNISLYKKEGYKEAQLENDLNDHYLKVLTGML